MPAARGLLNVVLATGLGIAVSTQALRLGDALSRWLLDAGAQGQAAHRMGTLVDLASRASGSPVLVIVLGVIVFLVTLAQWLLLLLRQAGIVFLAPLLPLAAATSMTSSSSPALRRVLMWELSLLAYKPMVAFVYLVGFQVLGQASGVQGVLIGTVILVLAVIATPALLWFFSWAVDPSATGLHDGGRVLAGAAVPLSVTQTAATFGAFMARNGPGSLGGAGSGGGGGGGASAPTGADPAPSAPLPALPPARRSAQRALPAGPSSTPTVEMP